MSRPNNFVDQYDIFYLQNHTKIVTKDELHILLPSQPYEKYQETFYKRKLNEVFEKSYNKEWFIYRYLNDQVYENRRQEYINILHNFDIPSGCIVIKNIHYGISGEELTQAVSKCLNLEKCYIQQNNSIQGFSRNCYITLKEGSNVEDSIEFMKSVIDKELRLIYNNFDTSELEEPMIIAADEEFNEAKMLFSSLCKIFNIEEEEVLEKYLELQKAKEYAVDTSSTTYYTNALKDIFLYCFTCGCQYDSSLSMMIECKSHKPSDFNKRKRKLLLNISKFSNFKKPSIEAEIEKKIEKTDEYYYCLMCEKGFSGMEYAVNHLHNKHQTEVNSWEEKMNNYNKFVERIDPFIRGFMEGTDDNTLPHFIVKKSTDARTVYLLPHWFSGEIKMDN